MKKAKLSPKGSPLGKKDYFSKFKKALKLFLWWLGGLIIVAILALGAFSAAFANKIYPNVYLASQNFGGLTREQAESRLATILQSQPARSLELVFANQSWELAPKELGLNYDSDKTVDRLFSFGRQGSIWVRIKESALGLFRPQEIPAKYSYKEDKFQAILSQIKEKIDQPEQDATLKISQDLIEIIPERQGRKIDQDAFQTLIFKSWGNFDFQPIFIPVLKLEPKVLQPMVVKAKKQTEKIVKEPLVLKSATENFQAGQAKIGSWLEFIGLSDGTLDVRFNQSKIANFAKEIASQIDRESVNARLAIDGGRATVFQASQNGLTLDQPKTAALLVAALLGQGERQINLPIKVQKAEINESSMNDLGIKERLGGATTSFRKSPQNRISNIKNGVKFLNGILIKPGETFSTVERLGAVDSSTGYLPELVIKENRTIPEFGGGLCQVSTTLFRAALDAGLPIEERQNHSYRVSYYEPPIGLDATVYSPKPDLKFKNDTPGWILLQGLVNEGKTTVTFEFYGTKDGRQTKIEGPYTSDYVSPPEPIYEETPDLPQGETQQIEKPHQGAKSVAYYIVTRDGKEIIRQTFVSKYKALPARYRVGTGTPPPAETPPPPAEAPPGQ